ncbi:GyrI-like domain-containing protein [Rossellomorea sp. YZS02]|uniref:GyrI-like domain-containing protein n=1 Tax=Rossellomorea sp. YZS02 TaxID=3097358 RepID=UPI002A11F909|nr:GyrI-like domain-containing protein [Rossellomorea sp. YZS02]MDX8342349.1 GyrI-like domain-containing protein [Rossellomorea sp. YZS02]
MKSEIVKIQSKKLLGKSKVMSLSEDSTKELWQSFMPHRKAISHRVDEMLYNMKIFEPGFDVKQLSPVTPFRKWAAVEVESFESRLEGMEIHTLKGGLYAKFLHHGPASTFHKTLEYIHTEWMPESEYQLDDREHFERFDEHYNPADPSSVEEVWIPIRRGTDL